MCLASTKSPEQLLQTYLTCLENGAVFVVKGDRGLIGSCCVEQVGHCAVLRSLPKDNGIGLGKFCLEEVQKWARHNDLDIIQVSTENWNGSSFKYFEKSLGFRRHTVVFERKV